MTDKVQSPCIGVCRLKKGVCIGCFRTAKEITEWWDADSVRKIEIVNASNERKAQFESQ